MNDLLNAIGKTLSIILGISLFLSIIAFGPVWFLLFLFGCVVFGGMIFLFYEENKKEREHKELMKQYGK